jgi:hypothetical protein
MAIDRADWHYGGEFPADLAPEYGATHIGMYLTWIINNHLEGDIHHEDENTEKALEEVRNRKMTGRDFFMNYCDEKFWNDDLNEDGLAFTTHYYSGENGGYGPYMDDYVDSLVGDLPNIYYVEDTWENYDKLSKVIEQRYVNWKRINNIL